VRTPLLVAVGAAALLAGCDTMRSWMRGGGPKATAKLEPTKGSNVRGSDEFDELSGGKLRVSADVSGLRPNGEFGFHIHEAGDMPSLRADASGNAKASFEVDTITVSPGPASIVGRGLIVHVQPDDYKTQPTGNAGARSACAVIQRN
jgi:Cu-Zn family superoxide dismutase